MYLFNFNKYGNKWNATFFIVALFISLTSELDAQLGRTPGGTDVVLFEPVAFS